MHFAISCLFRKDVSKLAPVLCQRSRVFIYICMILDSILQSDFKGRNDLTDLRVREYFLVTPAPTRGKARHGFVPPNLSPTSESIPVSLRNQAPSCRLTGIDLDFHENLCRIQQEPSNSNFDFWAKKKLQSLLKILHEL